MREYIRRLRVRLARWLDEFDRSIEPPPQVSEARRRERLLEADQVYAKHSTQMTAYLEAECERLRKALVVAAIPLEVLLAAEGDSRWISPTLHARISEGVAAIRAALSDRAQVRWRYNTYSPAGEDDWQDDEASAFIALQEMRDRDPETTLTRYVDRLNPRTGYWETNTTDSYEQWLNGRWVPVR